MSIRFEPDGHVVLITVDRPEARNALDPEHNTALERASPGGSRPTGSSG